MPLSLSDETMKHLQRFVILLYDRTSQSTQVDHSRKVLFATGRQIDRIPPTEATLKEHVKRALYQAGYFWGQTLVANQELPSPGEWGWKKSTILLPGRHFQKQPKCVKSLSNVVAKKSMSAAMQMRVCFTSMHRALQLRGNLLSIKTYWIRFNGHTYIHVLE